MEELKAAHLKLHILVYSGEKPFGCIQCNFSCTKAGNFRTHMLTHSGKKPFSCTQCKPPVYQPGTLRKRWLPIQETNLLVARSAKIPSQKLGTSNNTYSYTQEKIISDVHMTQCNHSCTRATHLKAHTLTHSGKKPFTCNVQLLRHNCW